jgi:hypothetical protein
MLGLIKRLLLSILLLISFVVYSDEQKLTVQLRSLAPHVAHQMVLAAVEVRSMQFLSTYFQLMSD